MINHNAPLEVVVRGGHVSVSVVHGLHPINRFSEKMAVDARNRLLVLRGQHSIGEGIQVLVLSILLNPGNRQE